MQDVRRKPPIKYNKDGSISLDGSGVKILRLLDPQGEPDVIECDGVRYVPERMCHLEPIPYWPGDYEGMRCSVCKTADLDMGVGSYCSVCGAKVVG